MVGISWVCWVRGPVLAAVVMYGCASTARNGREAPRIADTTQESAAPADPSVRERDTLVWVTDERGARRTYWLSTTAEGERVAAQAAGVIVAAGDALWLWRERTTQQPLYSCRDQEVWGNETELLAPSGWTTVTESSVVRLGTDEEIVVVDPDKPVGAEELEQHVTLLGSVGPYLFVVEETEGYYCGVHGATERDFTLWDLAAELEIDPPDEVFTEAERTALDAAERGHARALLATEDELKLSSPLEDVVLRALIPQTAHGDVGFEYVFTADTCYACGDGEWSDYMIAAQVPATSVPTLFRAYVTAPGEVLALVRREPGLRVGGWSVVSGAREARAHALEVFRSHREQAPAAPPQEPSPASGRGRAASTSAPD